MKIGYLLNVVQMLTMQLSEEEKDYDEKVKHKVELAQLENIVQRINSLKNLLVSIQKDIQLSRRAFKGNLMLAEEIEINREMVLVKTS